MGDGSRGTPMSPKYPVQYRAGMNATAKGDGEMCKIATDSYSLLVAFRCRPVATGVLGSRIAAGRGRSRRSPGRAPNLAVLRRTPAMPDRSASAYRNSGFPACRPRRRPGAGQLGTGWRRGHLVRISTISYDEPVGYMQWSRRRREPRTHVSEDIDIFA